MTRPIRDLGFGMAFVPELLMRQMLLEGLFELAGDEEEQTELFERLDDLLQGSQELWAKDVKAQVLKMTERDSRRALHVGISYPGDDAVYPYWSLVLENGSEDQAQATAGDILGVEYEQRGTPSATDPTASRVIRHTHLGTGWTSIVQLGTWAVSSEQSIIVSAIAKHLVLRHKGRLFAAGVHDISFTEGGFQPGERWPRIGYVPILRCTMTGTLRQTRRTGPVPTRTTVTSVKGSS